MPMKRFFLLLAMALPLSLAAQEAPKGIPADVYYLMPQFSPGYIFFRGLYLFSRADAGAGKAEYLRGGQHAALY